MKEDKAQPIIKKIAGLKWMIRIGLACFGLIVLCGLFFFRGYRATQLAEKAIEEMAGNPDRLRWESAWEHVRAAAYLAPEDLFVLRTAGEIGERMDPKRAYDFWVRAEILSSGAREDVEGSIRAALASGMLDEAAYKLNQYKESWGANNHYLYWQSIWYRKKDAVEPAIHAASQLMEQSEHFEDKWYYIQLALDAPLYKEQLKARKVIFELIEANNYPEHLTEMAQRALEIPDLSYAELRILEAHLGQSKEIDDQLSAYKLAIQRNGIDQEVFDKVISLFDLSESIERLRLGRWLNSIELYEETLRIVTVSDSLAHKDLFLVRLDALALLDRWEELQSLLSKKTVPLEPYWQALFRMRAAIEQADSRRADIEWKRALIAAGRDEQILLFQVRYTKALGLEAYTIEALEKMTESTLMMRKGFEALLVLRQRKMDTVAVRDTLKRMSVAYPNDFSVANDLAYYNLLLDEEIPESKMLLIHLMEDNPDLLSHRMSVILALLREGNPQDALRVMESTPVDWRDISNRWKIPAAVTLYENGYVDAAQQLAKNLDLEPFLEEERILLQPVFDSLK